jgi:mRNA interferase RelE/StbE
VAKRLIFTRNFKKNYKKVPRQIQERFDKQLRFFVENPKHPSLQIHRYKKEENAWEGYVSSGYRFTFSIVDEGYVFRNIGPHGIIEKGRV